MGFWEKEVVLGIVDKSKKDRIEVKRVTLKGREYCDVRVFYTDDDGESYKPGKGISIPADKLDAVIEFMQTKE